MGSLIREDKQRYIHTSYLAGRDLRTPGDTSRGPIDVPCTEYIRTLVIGEHNSAGIGSGRGGGTHLSVPRTVCTLCVGSKARPSNVLLRAAGPVGTGRSKCGVGGESGPPHSAQEGSNDLHA